VHYRLRAAKSNNFILKFYLHPGVSWGGNACERRSNTFSTFCFKMALELFENAYFWMRSYTIFVRTTSLFLSNCEEKWLLSTYYRSTCNLGNTKPDAGHIRCSRGPHLTRRPQVPHPCLTASCFVKLVTHWSCHWFYQP